MRVKGDSSQVNMKASPDASIPQTHALPAFASGCVPVYADDRHGTDRPDCPGVGLECALVWHDCPPMPPNTLRILNDVRAPITQTGS